jgi:hypothetical protein
VAKLTALPKPNVLVVSTMSLSACFPDQYGGVASAFADTRLRRDIVRLHS